MDGYLSTPRVMRAADVIMDQIERLILEGKVRPGQKLPSERGLAEEFDVSRPTVREAIQKLEARGLINGDMAGDIRSRARRFDVHRSDDDYDPAFS